MELRKDPITRSWVVIGHPEESPTPPDKCPFCPGHEGDTRTILQLPENGPWQVRVFPHFDPLYHIELDAGRRADGIYDLMQPLGAHEIIVETPDHNLRLSQLSEPQIELVLQAFTQRITDLKKDARFKYITVFKNQGSLAGQEWTHANSQLTATTFLPRRILYELRSARDYFQQKERCVFCDIVRQEEKQTKRVVDSHGDFVAFCPYASRVPYEIWVLNRKHSASFEVTRPGGQRRHLAALLSRVLRRLERVSEAYHLVLHTSPNLLEPSAELIPFVPTLENEYHWHIEILPIVEKKSKSYSIKEVYFNHLLPEEAAEHLRQIELST